MLSTTKTGLLLAAVTCLTLVGSASAGTNVTVLGTDAIYLAGNTNYVPDTATDPLLTAPPNSLPNTAVVPPFLAAGNGEIFTFSTTGTVRYSPTDVYSSDGAQPDAAINALEGISAYNGPKGALVGVFLNDVPTQTISTSPSSIIFSGNTSFLNLSPGIGQVFFIGDGLTGTGVGTVQQFTAPTGATGLWLGIADGFNYAGAPGEYSDNSGSFTTTVTVVPEPDSTSILVIGLLLIGGSRRIIRCFA